MALSFGCGEPGGGGADVAFEEIFDDSEVTIEQTPVGERLRMDLVTFSFGSNELAGGVSSLAKFAELFARAPAGRYRIEVHTDDRGSVSENLALSQSRAEAVRDYLIAMAGASPQALAAEGFGEAFPIADNGTAQGRAQNRRVEITALRDDGTRAYRVRVAADVLDVVADCDDFTSSPEAAAGDFWVHVGFSIAADGRTDVAATTGTHLIYAHAGETIDLDLAAESIYWGTDGARIELDLRWYETDTGGVRHSTSRPTARPSAGATAKAAGSSRAGATSGAAKLQPKARSSPGRGPRTTRVRLLTSASRTSIGRSRSNGSTETRTTLPHRGRAAVSPRLIQ